MSPIGVFDSGYGGLTVFRELVARLPQYDFMYLGDNARAPYGTRSFETVYRYTLECVQWLFHQSCPLIILACNTASAKALRTIQQQDLERINPKGRVLGVIRPSSELIGHYSNSGSIGILATSGTVQSNSYAIEIQKFFPHLQITQQACPMWVPLIENGEHEGPGARFFIHKYTQLLMQANPGIDTVLLACTHYPLLQQQIAAALPAAVRVVGQGGIVAASLADYLQRHPEIEGQLTQGGQRLFYTTDSVADFNTHATVFFGGPVQAEHVDLKE